MNYKETLKKLHETFPDFDIDTIIKIMDCYISESSGWSYDPNIPLKRRVDLTEPYTAIPTSTITY